VVVVAVVVAVVVVAVPFTVMVPLKKVEEEDLEPRERQRIGADLGSLADQIGPIAHPHNSKIVVGFVNPLVLYFQEFVC
jgi:hypothetical protein